MTVSKVCPRCNSAFDERAFQRSGAPSFGGGLCASCSEGALGSGGRTLDDGWGDDDDGGGEGLELSRDGAAATGYADGGASFDAGDDPFADEIPDASLELDLPSGHTRRPDAVEERSGAGLPRGVEIPDLALPAPRAPVPAPPSAAPSAAPHPRGGEPLASAPLASVSPASARPEAPSAPAPASASAPAPPPERDPAAIIAGYPPPPSEAWRAPVYALHVIRRQLELRQDLAALRRRRSPDVALYERALGVHDARTFARGLALACAGLALATFLVFLPVIVRMFRD